MTSRICAALLALGLSLSIQGCGDDDGGGSGNGNGNGNGNGAGSGGGDGSGNGAGNGGGSNGDVTPEEALMGGCGNEQTGGDISGCETYDEYIECVQANCDPQACLEDAACEDYIACIEGADDACDNDCLPAGACTTCFVNIGTCTLSNCFDLIASCAGGGSAGTGGGSAGMGGGSGNTTTGGACDQLDDCCAGQADGMRQVCEAAAAGARAAGGDSVCAQAMSAFCQ